MRIEILRQMTDDELEYLDAYIFAYIEFIQNSIAEDKAKVYYKDFKELLSRAREDIHKVEQVQKERRQKGIEQ